MENEWNSKGFEGYISKGTATRRASSPYLGLAENRVYSQL
jgi:hypothetical protein